MPFCEATAPTAASEVPSSAGETIRHITKMVSDKLNLDQV